MTCIATDGKTMAADGLVMVHNAVVELDRIKLRRLKTGQIVGCAGESTEAEAFCDWLERSGQMSTWPELKQCDALVLNTDGTIDLYEEVNSGRSERMSAPMAIGSGMYVALGALHVGASPRRAVETAIRLCTTVGGTIVVMKPE